jgi:WD40 repeat protein
MKFEDGMKKVSAITWSSNGKKLAVASADKVLFILFRLSIYSMMLDRKKTNSQQSLQIRGKNLT